VDEADSEILLETSRFVIIADVAPVVEGHILAVSKWHAESAANLGAAALAELVELVAAAEVVVGGAYGPCCVFEHGSGDGPTDTACIEHAHVHIVPYSGDLRELSSYRESFAHIPGWESLDRVPADVGYLFTRSSEHQYWLAVRQRVERQHWRRTLAAAAGSRHPDWRLMSVTSRGRDLARRRVLAVRALFDIHG